LFHVLELLLSAHIAPVAHLGATDLDRLRDAATAMTHGAVAAIWQFQVFHTATKESASAIST
jgi:hypothetical protein